LAAAICHGRRVAVGTDRSQASQVYLVERYSPGMTTASAEAAVAAVGQACAGRRSQGSAVRLVWSLVMPDDEALFLVIEAVGTDLIAGVCTEAGLAFDRATPALVVGDGSR
jgi:hypothetical protein